MYLYRSILASDSRSLENFLRSPIYHIFFVSHRLGLSTRRLAAIFLILYSASSRFNVVTQLASDIRLVCILDSLLLPRHGQTQRLYS